MKKDVEIKLQTECDRRLREMPDFIADFIIALREQKDNMNLRTQISYIKDYTIFLEYLLELPEFKDIEKIGDFNIEHIRKLEEKDISGFLTYLTYYSKSFKRKNGKEYTQSFTNTQIGKSRKIAGLHTLFQWLERQKDYKITDITKYIEVKVNAKKQIKDSLTDEEVNRLISVIVDDINIESNKASAFHQKYKNRDIAMFYIMAYTGIRISELVQLDIKDVSLKDGKMIVIRKGGDEEILYLPEEGLPLLEEYIESRKAMVGIETQYKNALFLSNQLRRIDPRTVRYMLDKYRERANIEIKLTPHTLRRTFAIKMLDITNGNVKIVADILGHSTTATTERFYVKILEERKRNALVGFGFRKS